MALTTATIPTKLASSMRGKPEDGDAGILNSKVCVRRIPSAGGFYSLSPQPNSTLEKKALVHEHRSRDKAAAVNRGPRWSA